MPSECSGKWGVECLNTCVKKSNLASRCIPSEVVRENGAPKATNSTYLFRLVINFFIQALPHAFYVLSSSIFDTLFSKVNRGLPLSLLPLIFPFSVMNVLYHSFLIHSFDMPKLAAHVLFLCHCDFFASIHHSV